MIQMRDFKKTMKKVWFFIWEDNSVWSWLVNILLAFVLIKFVVYPGLGFLLSTSYPIVAVVSSSMEHDGSYNAWWDSQANWYMQNGISKDEFSSFSLKSGFNKGDIMILYGTTPRDLQVGDVIVFKSARPDPIIHRIVKKWEDKGIYYFQTKGDHNSDSIRSTSLDETRIRQDQYLGRAVIRVPLIGYVKIWFVDLINLIRG